MRMVSVRELRSNSARIWDELSSEKDIVITSNGKPIGVLSSTSESELEQSLRMIRKARAMAAVSRLQMESAEKGREKIPLEEINEEIKRVRRERPR